MYWYWYLELKYWYSYLYLRHGYWYWYWYLRLKYWYLYWYLKYWLQYSNSTGYNSARRWPERVFGTPAGMAVVKSTGNVVVADASRRIVMVHSPAVPPLPLCCIRSDSDKFFVPTHVTVDSSGMILFCR